MNEKVLEYPSKSMDLAFAIDGYWQPILIVINENLLADEICWRMEDEITDCEDDRSEFDIIYEVDKDPFRFTVDVNFDKYHIGYGVNPGDRIRVNEINIETSWGKNSEGLSNSLPIKWNKELLKSILEMQVHLPLI